MANTRINNAVALTALNAIVDALDVGTAQTEGYIEIRTGGAPAECETASSGTLLATLPCSNPAFGAAADAAPHALATAFAITDDTSADSAGTAGYFRGFSRDDVCVIQGDVSATGGGGDLQLNTVLIALAATVSVTAWTITLPEA